MKASTIWILVSGGLAILSGLVGREIGKASAKEQGEILADTFYANYNSNFTKES